MAKQSQSGSRQPDNCVFSVNPRLYRLLIERPHLLFEDAEIVDEGRPRDDADECYRWTLSARDGEVYIRLMPTAAPREQARLTISSDRHEAALALAKSVAQRAADYGATPIRALCQFEFGVDESGERQGQTASVSATPNETGQAFEMVASMPRWRELLNVGATIVFMVFLGYFYIRFLNRLWRWTFE